ncbi:hypothetical protein [Candidatus Ichthyocystis hellenicum]|uniref:hypothetical protein n=1 Tax=Candidatus Ichthyocystis hellenicum TaxID=1561003 RepID=UPI000B870DAB|nr:hypothetical protein [Candidatus Ichthyocystis hellenicum]
MSPEFVIAEYQKYIGMDLPDEVQGSAFQLEDPSRGWLFGLDSDRIHVIPFYAIPAIYFDAEKKEKALISADIRRQRNMTGLAVSVSEINNQEWIVAIMRISPQKASLDVIDDSIARLQRFLTAIIN